MLTLIQDCESEKSVQLPGKPGPVAAIEVKGNIEIPFIAHVFRQAFRKGVQVIVYLPMDEAEGLKLVISGDVRLLVWGLTDAFHSQDVMIARDIGNLCFPRAFILQKLPHVDGKTIRVVDASVKIYYAKDALTHILLDRIWWILRKINSFLLPQ